MKFKIIKLIQSKLFPSPHQKMVKKWHKDDGENVFRLTYDDLNSDSIILDLGGYKGQWASDIFSKYNANIFIFEPITIFANNIMDRFKKNKKIQVLPFGIGAKTRFEKISLDSDASSIVRDASNKNMEIKIVDIEEWISTNKISNIDLLKINIEGGEYETLEKLIEINFIKNIKHLQIQFHDFFPDARCKMEKIRKELAKTHTQHYSYDFVWDGWSIT